MIAKSLGTYHLLLLCGYKLNFYLFSDKNEGEGENAESVDSKQEEGSKKDDKKKEKANKKVEEKKVKKEPKKPKIETLKESLDFEVSILDLSNMTAEQKKSSKEKLDALTAHDRQKKAR